MNQMKTGELKQFILLFDAYFPDLYRYVARRIGQGERANEIVRLSFLDALGQVQNTPADTSYPIWLYSLAKPRVWDEIERVTPRHGGPKAVAGDNSEDEAVRFDKMLKKLSFEEREILRLKFFEEVSDGDVMTILALEEGLIGPKIYRVLKRVHFLLFGESDERQGVYFGELSGFLARVREREELVIPEAFKLNLRADLGSRIDRKDFAIDVEAVEEKRFKETPPFAEKPMGSSDPAKIFVQAVKEMREDEKEQILRDQEKLQRQEKVFDFIDRFKVVLSAIPALVFGLVVGIFVWKFVDFGPATPVDVPDVPDGGNGEELIVRGYPTECDFKIDYKGIFTDGERRGIDQKIVNELCDSFELTALTVLKKAQEVIYVDAFASEYRLSYKFINKDGEWLVQEYAKTFDSNKKPGKIPRDKRSAPGNSI